MLATTVHVGNDRLRKGKLQRRHVESRCDSAMVKKDNIKDIDSIYFYCSVQYNWPCIVSCYRQSLL